MKHHHIALYIDLLFCLVIVPLTIMLLPVDRWMEHNAGFLIALVIYVYALYFVYRYFKLPRMLMQRQWGKVAFLMLVLIAVTVGLTYFPSSSGYVLRGRGMRTQTIWFFFLVVTGFSLAIELTFELFRQILQRQAIEAEKNKAELALYKAQINPHFLFNTLNTLYALVLSGSDKTESAFVKFSGILRYMYSQSESELTPAGAELDYIRQYVDLQCLRLNRHTRVDLQLDADNRHTLIPPMILITFVENAFKYGTSSDTDCCIRIDISLKKGVLRLHTENAVMRRRTDGRQGIGMANCLRRLELLYPDRYELHAGEAENGLYKVNLCINLI